MEKAKRSIRSSITGTNTGPIVRSECLHVRQPSAHLRYHLHSLILVRSPGLWQAFGVHWSLSRATCELTTRSGVSCNMNDAGHIFSTPVLLLLGLSYGIWSELYLHVSIGLCMPPRDPLVYSIAVTCHCARTWTCKVSIRTHGIGVPPISSSNWNKGISGTFRMEHSIQQDQQGSSSILSCPCPPLATVPLHRSGLVGTA